MGIKRAQPLYDIRDGKIKAISANYADKILSVFPEYSRAWLITGEGQPFSENKNEEYADEGIVITKKNNSMTTSERFLKVMDDLKINPYILEKEIGVKYAQAKISHYKKGVTKTISSDIIVRLCEAYPQVNANYILTGKGNMFLNSESPELLSKEEVEGMPSPESAEYWERMYKSTLVIYESLLDDLQNRFDELDNSLKQIHSVFKGRREAV